MRPLPLAMAVLAVGCGPAEDHHAQARALVEAMDLRTRAAQVIVAPLGVGDGGAGARRLERLSAAGGVGGVWVSGGDPAEVAAAIRRAQAAAPIPLLVAGSVDGGAPLLGATRMPSAVTVAALAGREDARVAGSIAAREAAAVGVRLGFVAMPPTNGSAPLAFAARDPGRATEGIGEFIRGMHDAGVLPGVLAFWTEDGEDPLLAWDRARLDALELAALRPIVREEIGAVWLGPLRLPALTGDSAHLPTSPAAARGLLLRQLGFEGLVAADVGAGSPLARRFGEAEAAVRVLASGAHLVLRASDPAAVAAAIVAAVEDGRIGRVAVDSAAVRVVALRLRAASGTGAPAPDTLHRLLRAPAAVTLARRLTALAAAPALPAPAPLARLGTPADGGFDSARLAVVDSILSRSLDDSVYTAAALAIGRRGSVVRLRGFGRGVDPRRTVFDVASLTKPVATTTAVALLIDRGLMRLDDPVRRHLREWSGEGKDGVTIAHLLSHTSGLPAGLWLFGSAGSPEHAIRQALAQPLLHPPGERVLYSDLGMILLAVAIERAAEEPLDQLLARHVFAPLGMQHTMYLPPLALAQATIPTARPAERDFVLRAVVHDANAFRIGGVAGHAGLFSTARDLAVFAQMILNGGAYGTASVLDPATLQSLTARGPGTENRAFGWDTPADRSSAGRYFSADAFGHTGYTGTSLWIDPRLDLFVVLLTNRTFTGASALDVLRVRSAVHEAVARAISDTTVAPRAGARPVR